MTEAVPVNRAFLAAAPLVFAVTWSTGNIATKLGMPYAEPLTFLALRFAIGAAVLATIAVALRAPWPASLGEAGHIVVAGLLLHGVYLCSVFVAIDEGVATGTLALIVGLQPLLTACVVGSALGEHVPAYRWTGLVLGLLGVALVVWNKIEIAEGSGFGMALGGISVLGLTAGTVYQKRFCAGMDLRTGTALQQAATALATAVLVLAFEGRTIEWTGEFVFAVAWLVLVVTVGAFNLLMYLLRLGEASRVVSLFYLTPPITAAMGHFMFGEGLGPVTLVGMAVAVAGFALAAR